MLRVFGHHIPRSLLLLLVLESLTLVGSFEFARAWFTGDVTLAGAFGGAALLPVGVLLGTMQIAGLHDDHGLEGMLGMALRLALAFGVGVITLALLAAYGFAPRADGPWLLTGVLLALTLIMIERLCLFRWMLAERFRRRVLVLGSGPRAREIEQLIHRSSGGKRFHLVGYLAESPLVTAEVTTASPVWSMPGEGELLSFAQRHRVQEIVVASCRSTSCSTASCTVSACATSLASWSARAGKFVWNRSTRAGSCSTTDLCEADLAASPSGRWILSPAWSP